jgi:hypothetical protein
MWPALCAVGSQLQQKLALDGHRRVASLVILAEILASRKLEMGAEIRTFREGKRSLDRSYACTSVTIGG